MRLLRRVGVHLLTLATLLALDAVWLGLAPAGHDRGRHIVP